MKPAKHGFFATKLIAGAAALLACVLAPVFLFILQPFENAGEQQLFVAAAAGTSTQTPDAIELLQAVSIEPGAKLVVEGDSAAETTSKTGAAQSLSLNDAHLTIDQSAKAVASHRANGKSHSSDRTAASPLDRLRRGDIGELNVNRMSLQVRRPGGSIVYIGRFDGKLTLSGGRLHLDGSLLRQGYSLDLDLEVGPDSDGIGERAVTIAIDGALMRFALNGQLYDLPGPRLKAEDAALTTSNMTTLLSWLGLASSGQGVSQFEAKSSFEWSGSTIALDNGSFKIDGNQAEGRMTFDLAAPGSSIDATLAFDVFDITPYLTPSTVAEKSKALMLNLWDVMQNAIYGSKENQQALADIHADLRISVQTLRLADRTLGSGAAVVLLRDGKLQADFADVTLVDGAKGNAQFQSDITGYLPSYGLRGKFTEIDLGRLTTTWFDKRLLDGTGDLAFDLEAEGRTHAQMLATLSGEARLRSRRGATIGLDLASLFAKSKATPSDGWGSFVADTSAIDTLILDLKASRGSIETKAVKARQGRTLMIADGTLRLRDLVLDLILSRQTLDETATTRTVSAPLTAGQEALQFHGPLFKPIIRYIGPADRG